MTSMIGIIDYGVGNIKSVYFAVEAAGGNATLISDGKDLAGMDALVLPGVGAFAHTAKAFADSGLREPTLDIIAAGKPVLGICVGMQLLFEESHEFMVTPGLGLLKGAVKKIEPRPEDPSTTRLPVIGWFKTNDMGPDRRGYYFLHSFAAQPEDPEVVFQTYTYQNTQITASVVRDNVMGTQYHPERSGADGLCLMSQFVKHGTIVEG